MFAAGRRPSRSYGAAVSPQQVRQLAPGAHTELVVDRGFNTVFGGAKPERR